MADEFNTSPNWWDSSRININRFDAAAAGSSSSSSSGLNSTNLGNFGWATDQMVDIKPSAAGRSSMDSVSVSDSNNSVVFQDTQKLQVPESAHDHHDDHHLHMMGLGLSSRAIDWNQALLTRGDKAHESSFRSMLQDNLNSNTAYQQEAAIGMASSSSSSSQAQWMREKIMFPTEDSSSVNEFKQISRGFSLDHQSQFSSSSNDHSSNSTVTCQGLPSSTSNFQQMDNNSANLYGSPILQGLLGSDHDQQQSSFDQNRSSLMSYHHHQYGGSNSMNYGIMNSNEQLMLPSCWSNSNKVAQFLRASPPKQQQQQQPPPHNSQLHFSNNAPFWNASATSSVNCFFPSMQTQFPTPNFDEKPKQNISKIRDSSSVVKKSGSDQPASKRPRNETASPLPASKVRKEKMGDRITALQQLVSPFGKTDTASVLSEAIEYIKFLHEQVTVLSTPYMKSGASLQHQQNFDKSKDLEEHKQDLKSRGLCLVPVSSTFPVNHETTVDFWTPTFGGTFR